jgi:hypothetical protein
MDKSDNTGGTFRLRTGTGIIRPAGTEAQHKASRDTKYRAAVQGKYD